MLALAGVIKIPFLMSGKIINCQCGRRVLGSQMEETGVRSIATRVGGNWATSFTVRTTTETSENIPTSVGNPSYLRSMFGLSLTMFAIWIFHVTISARTKTIHNVVQKL